MNNPEELAHANFNEFQKMMLEEFVRPGITILSDVIVSDDSSRIMKIIIDYDITDAKPARRGKKDITWSYFYNYPGKPIILTAAYPLESDKLVGEKILISIKPFSVRPESCPKK